MRASCPERQLFAGSSMASSAARLGSNPLPKLRSQTANNVIRPRSWPYGGTLTAPDGYARRE
eukprot:2103712-Prymnesium_polylepis.1